MSKWTLKLASLAILAPIYAADAPLYIFGGQGHKEFLGCLNCGTTHPKSVWNELSTYGFKNSVGLWNPFREYVDAVSSYSMCNEFAADPPVIVDAEGNYYGRLTVNRFTSGSVCAVSGVELLCNVVQAVCKKD